MIDYSKREPGHHTHTAGEPLDYDYIDEGIYLGSNQCCLMGLAEVLQKEGVSADISLEGERLDQPQGVEVYTWLPIPDGTPPSSEQLAYGVMSLTELVRQGRKIYLHCQNGHGRSTTLLSAYLIATRGMTPEEAFTYIKERRSGVHLTDVQWHALESYYKNSSKNSS